MARFAANLCSFRPMMHLHVIDTISHIRKGGAYLSPPSNRSASGYKWVTARKANMVYPVRFMSSTSVASTVRSVQRGVYSSGRRSVLNRGHQFGRRTPLLAPQLLRGNQQYLMFSTDRVAQLKTEKLGRKQEDRPKSLYAPDQETENCGVGLIASLKSVPSRDIVEKADEMLVRMSHRGGCGCDPASGDGSGRFFLFVILIGVGSVSVDFSEPFVHVTEHSFLLQECSLVCLIVSCVVRHSSCLVQSSLHLESTLLVISSFLLGPIDRAT